MFADIAPIVPDWAWGARHWAVCDDEAGSSMIKEGPVASSTPEKAPAHTVSPQDEPSAEWGWHGSFPKGTRIAGWFTAFAMFLMLIGNHTGRTEDLWLIGTGAGLVILLVIDQIRRRTSWRR